MNILYAFLKATITMFLLVLFLTGMYFTGYFISGYFGEVYRSFGGSVGLGTGIGIFAMTVFNIAISY